MVGAVGTQLMVVLLFMLAAGLAVGQYVSLGRERMRRIDLKIRRRATRRRTTA
jgi:hypothetical protein